MNYKYEVAILILLELTLQLKNILKKKKKKLCRNPYFIGINSAILGGLQHGNDLLKVAILILLELTLQ